MPDPVQLFRSYVPDSFLVSALRAVIEGCTSAHATTVARFSPARMREGVPALRRLEVEQRLGDMLIDTSVAVRTIEPTPSTSYSRFSFGGGAVTLTALTRTHRVDRVQKQPYRTMLAVANQLTLWSSGATPAPKVDLYALLVYGGKVGKALPDLAMIRFPLPSGRFLEDGLDLLKEFPQVVSEYTHHVSVVPATPAVALKPVAKDEAEESPVVTLKTGIMKDTNDEGGA